MIWSIIFLIIGISTIIQYKKLGESSLFDKARLPKLFGIKYDISKSDIKYNQYLTLAIGIIFTLIGLLTISGIIRFGI